MKIIAENMDLMQERAKIISLRQCKHSVFGDGIKICFFIMFKQRDLGFLTLSVPLHGGSLYGNGLNMNAHLLLAGIGVKSRFEVTEEECQNSYSFCSLCLTDKISY